MSDKNINEKVDIDGRTRAYRETVMRLESARKLREQRNRAMQENKFGGLYDDGSGKGAVVPPPVDINFHEAMKTIEKYKALREKKKTLMGNWKEKAKVNEASVETNDLLDAVEKAYKKGGLRGDIAGYRQLGFTDRTTVEDILDDMKGMFGNDKKFAAAEIKGFLKPQDYAKFKSRMESVEFAEAAEPVVEAGATLIKDKFAIGEEDLSPAQKKYRAFFNKALKKFGADSPADLDDAKKKELFNYVKKNYKAEGHDILPPHGKKLDEEELSAKQKEYRAFFDKALKKFGASSPAKMDDDKKKKFFDYVKANWKG